MLVAVHRPRQIDILNRKGEEKLKKMLAEQRKVARLAQVVREVPI